MRNKTAFFEEIYVKPKKEVWYKQRDFWAAVFLFTAILLGIIM